MPENHKFEKLSITNICKICMKPKLHEYHLDFLTEEDKIQSNLKTRAADSIFDDSTQIVDGIEVPWIGKNKPVPSAKDSEKHPQYEGQQQIFTEKVEIVKESIEETDKPNCYGHRCPSCGTSFFHSYKCWPGTTEMLHCPKCFGQANVEIHRNEDVNFIANQQGHVMNLREIAEKLVEKESFFYNQLQRPDYEDWFINVHWPDLQRKIENLRIDQAASKKALTNRREQDLSKLTPEEIEQYRRLSARQKKIKEVDTKEADKKEWATMLKNQIKLVGNEELARKQLTKLYKSEGKEIPE